MTNDELLYYGPVPGEGRRIQAVRIESYPDGAPRISFPRDATVERVLLRPRSMASFVAGLFWIDALIERGGQPPELILPFMPGARQDRLNATGDFLFTARSVARMINERILPAVTVVDPHSDVTPALIDNCRVVKAEACVNPPAGKYAAVIAPDGGAEKRAGEVARKLGVPLFHAWKTRNVSDGSIAGFGIEHLGLPGGSRVLVVDDICDGGGTFVGLADAITKQAAQSGPRIKRDLYVTHGLFTKGTEELLSRFDHVYCTDSVIADRPRVIEASVCERLLTDGRI